MKVIFLNTWHGRLHDELRAYVKHHLASTAVFCFQEAETNGLDRLPYEDLLANDFELYTVTKAQATTQSRYGNSIYVRKTISVLEDGSIFAEDPADFNVGLALFVKLDIDGAELTICNVHGLPHPGHKLDTAARLHQSQKIIETFADRSSVIIGGDFNLLPESQSVKTFAEHGYRNLISDFAIATTRNKITFDQYPDNIQYYADYAFVSPSLAVDDFAVPSDIVSDHQPLELTILVEAPRTVLDSKELGAVDYSS